MGLFAGDFCARGLLESFFFFCGEFSGKVLCDTFASGFMWESFMGDLSETFSEVFTGSLLCETFVGYFCWRFLRESFAGDFWGTDFQDGLAGNYGGPYAGVV